MKHLMTYVLRGMLGVYVNLVIYITLDNKVSTQLLRYLDAGTAIN